MTVKELMEQLKEYPDDYTITVEKNNYTDDFDEYDYFEIDEIYKNDYDKEITIEVW